MKGAISSVWDAGKYIVMSAHAGKHLQNIKKCRDVYVRLWQQGRSVLQLTVAA